MAIVRPQGILHLLRGIPLTNTYEHSIYFESAAEQERYFLGRSFKSFTDISYMGEGVIKIEARADEIRECSYIMYKNIGFSDKWFYAFCNGIQRISNEVSAISFQIDVLQTWYLFDTQLRPCMVEREHVRDDSLFKNYIPEGLETGDYLVQSKGWIMDNLQAPYAYLFAVTQYYDPHYEGGKWRNVEGNIMYNGMFCGVKYFAPPTANEASWFLSRYQVDGRADAILSIVTCPRFAIPYKDGGLEHEVADFTDPAVEILRDARVLAKVTDLQCGYKPYNNKLYVYPYNYMKVINHEGQELDMRYEYSTGKCIEFFLVVAVTCAPQAILFAENYLSNSNKNYINPAVSIASGIFSQVPYTTDNYRSWLAQTAATRANNASLAAANLGLQTANNINRNDMAANAVKMQGAQNALAYVDAVTDLVGMGSASFLERANTAIDKAVTAAYTNEIKYASVQAQSRIEKNEAAFAVTSAQHAIKAINAQVQDHSVIPPSGKGNMVSDTIQAIGFKGFQILNCQVGEEYARRIDMYFQMFGYQVNQIKIPETHSRELWTYCKTTNCNVMPVIGKGCSAADLANINTIFNNGVTFWRGEMGMINFMQYDQENKVVD